MTDTIATALVAELERHGITRGYGVPGESYLAVLDALYESPIEVITCRQEGGASYMAMAEGRLTNTPGLLLVTRGPGASNGMIGIHCAYEEGVPMVAVVGLPAHAARGVRSFQEFDFEQWFNATAKHVVVLDEPEQARYAVDNALRIASSGRPGPVIIGVPEDILLQEVPPAPERKTPTTVTPGEPAGAQGAISALETTVDTAERPVIVVGDDALSETGARRLEAWCRQRQIPTVADFRCYALVDTEAETYVGALGMGQPWPLTEWISEADHIIYLGCVRSEANSGHYAPAYDKPTTIIGSPELLPFHGGRVDELIDIRSDLLCRGLSETEAEAAVPQERSQWLARARQAYLPTRDVEAATAPGGRLEPYRTAGRMTGAIRDLLPEGTIVTFGAGTFTGVPQTLIPPKTHKGVLGNKNGSMGFGVPAGIAAKLARPEAPVLIYSGDGDFLMNGQELATAAMFGAAVVVVVVDNSRYGTIRNHQERDFPGRVSGTDLQNPDFRLYAEAFGGRYLDAEEVTENPALFTEALEDSSRFTLIHAREH